MIEVACSTIATTVILILIVLPIANWIFIMKNRPFLDNEDFKEKYEAAYENLRTSSANSLGYFSFFMFKRLLFATILFVL